MVIGFCSSSRRTAVTYNGRKKSTMLATTSSTS